MDINFLIRSGKIICLIMILFFVFYEYSYSSDVWIEGTTTCREQGKIELERPAKCIIVMPKNTPEAAVITHDNGFYAINLQIKDVIDKRLTLSFFSKSELIYEKTKYIWYDEIKGKKRTFKFPTVCLKKECELVEDEGKCRQTQAHLRLLRLRAEKPLKKTSGWTWPILLSLIGGVAAAGAAGGAAGDEAGPGPGPPPVIEISDKDIKHITAEKIEDGKFLSYAFSGMSRNTGFLISPTRNIGDAVFFNPSAIAMSSYGQLNAYTNLNSNRYSQAGIALPVKEEFGLGIGFLSLDQKETRTAFTESNESLSGPFYTVESAIFLSGSKRLRENLSVGLTTKYLSQDIETPEKIRITTYPNGDKRKSFIVNKAEQSFIDYDLSMTLKNTPAIQTGLSLMNIKGTKLLANDGKREKIRAAGVGASYKKKRMHLGIDIKLAENGDFDLSAGINFVPFTNVKLNFGLASAFDTLIFGAEYKYLTYTFNRNEVFDVTHFIGLKINF